MCQYYYDEEHAIAYKIDPVTATLIDAPGKDSKAIMVHANVKITNYKKEKIRRILSEVYPADQYDPESAKKEFVQTLLTNLVGGATEISEENYKSIKDKVELQVYSG